MKNENQTEKVEKNDFDIDLFRFLDRVLSNLKWIIICVSFALFIAFLFNRYLDRLYKAQALINVAKDGVNPFSSSTSVNFIYGGATNKMGTLKAIIASRSHNEKVIDALNLLTTYYKVGNIKTSEAHKNQMPFIVEYDFDHIQWVDQIFDVELIDEQTFNIHIKKIKSFNLYSLVNKEKIPQYKAFINKYAEKLKEKKTYKFTQWIETPLCKFKLLLNTRQSRLQYLNTKHCQFILNTKDNLVSQMISQIKTKDSSDEHSNSSLIIVTMKGKNMDKIVDYINTSNSILTKNQLDQKNRVPENTVKFIESKLSEIRDSMAKSSERLKNVRSSDRIIDLSTQGSNALRSVVDLEMKKEDVERQLEVLRLFQGHLQWKDYKSLIAPSLAGVNDPVLVDNIKAINRLYQEQQKLSEIYDPSSKPIRELHQQISLLRAQALSAINGYIASIRSQVNGLGAQLSKIDCQVKTLPSKEQRYVEAERLYIINNQQYNQMLIKLNEALLTKQSNVSDIDIIDPAKNIGQPYISPRPTFNYVIALLIGFFLPIIYMFIREVFDNKVKVMGDVVKYISAPLIGVISESNHGNNLVVSDKPKSGIAESFRAIRSNLKFIYEKGHSKTNGLNVDEHDYNRTILITSSISGEGKTFISINLASVFALINKKTLLIGMDLRKPKIFEDFNVKNDIGLSNYLVGHATKDQVIQRTKIPHLDVLTSGPIPPNPSELLLNEALPRLINELKIEYKYIVFDTPPIGLVADAYELMKFTDTNLYVIRNNYSYRDQFQHINDKYKKGELPNLYFILNGYVHPNYGYGYGYGYGSFEEDNMIKKSWISKIKRFLGMT